MAARRKGPTDAARSTTKTARFSAGGFRSRFGPIGTGRGTCQKGPVRLARTAGGADVCGFARAYVGLGEPSPSGMMDVEGIEGNRIFVQMRLGTALDERYSTIRCAGPSNTTTTRWPSWPNGSSQ